MLSGQYSLITYKKKYMNKKNKKVEQNLKMPIANAKKCSLLNLFEIHSQDA